MIDTDDTARAAAERLFPAPQEHQRRTAAYGILRDVLNQVEQLVTLEWRTAMRAAGSDDGYCGYGDGQVAKATPAQAARLLFKRAYSLGNNHRNHQEQGGKA